MRLGWLLILCALLLVAPARAQESERTEIDRILEARRVSAATSGYEGNCHLPAAGEHDRVILVTGVGAGQFANVRITPPEIVTTVGVIHVQPGREKIYLILATEPGVIWRFDGAVSRLSALVMIAYGPAAYTGAERVPFTRLQTQHCFSLDAFFPDPAGADVARAIIRTEIGRPPDLILQQMSAEISIPDNPAPPPRVDQSFVPEPPPAPSGFDPEVWRNIHLRGRFAYRGLVSIDPRAVRGAVATPVDVMPGWLGVAQLVSRGRLQAMPQTEDGWQNFRLAEGDVVLPLGLDFEDMSMRLYLPAGAAYPAGNLRGVCMVDEASGQWVGPIAAFCQERAEAVRRNIEEHQRFLERSRQ